MEGLRVKNARLTRIVSKQSVELRKLRQNIERAKRDRDNYRLLMVIFTVLFAVVLLFQIIVNN